MKQYKELAKKVLEEGSIKYPARDNMPHTTSLFGPQMEFNVSYHNFPIITSKKVSFKAIVVELLWFMKGITNVAWLNDHKVTIWNEDSYAYYCKKCEKQGLTPASFEEYITVLTSYKFRDIIYAELSVMPDNYVVGDTGMQYGALWRNLPVGNSPTTSQILHLPDVTCLTPEEVLRMFNSGGVLPYTKSETVYYVDQLKEVYLSLKNNPNGRRHIVSSWNVPTLDDMALNACHSLFQFNCSLEKEGVSDIQKLDLKLYQRSADLFLGVPYNISSYALLLLIFSTILNYSPGRFIHSFGDVHIYSNHDDAVKQLLENTEFDLPTLSFSERFLEDVVKLRSDDITFEDFVNQLGVSDFELLDYKHAGQIKGELSTGIKK